MQTFTLVMVSLLQCCCNWAGRHTESKQKRDSQLEKQLCMQMGRRCNRHNKANGEQGRYLCMDGPSSGDNASHSLGRQGNVAQQYSSMDCEVVHSLHNTAGSFILFRCSVVVQMFSSCLYDYRSWQFCKKLYPVWRCSRISSQPSQQQSLTSGSLYQVQLLSTTACL